jgi:transposase
MDRPAALPPDIWERTPPAAQTYIRALEARVAALEGMMQALQAQLKQTSQNSSRPPSSDPPQHPRPRRPRGQRRRGGQPGHAGHTRTLVPVEDVQEFVVLKPVHCPHCQTPFSGDDPAPWRHQVVYTTAADNSLPPKTRYNVPLSPSPAGALPWYQLSFSTNSVSWRWGASS